MFSGKSRNSNSEKSATRLSAEALKQAEDLSAAGGER